MRAFPVSLILVVFVVPLFGCDPIPVPPSLGGVLPAEQLPEPATTGGIQVKVTHKGGKEVPRPTIPVGEADCVAMHPAGLRDDTVVTGPAGELANVFVWIEGIDKKWKFNPPGPATIDQHGCVYLPHAFTMMKGQDILLKNSDTVSHNVHATPNKNERFNVNQLPGKSELKKSPFTLVESPFRIKCEVHGWMGGWTAVFDHPFHGVTDAAGTLDITGVPEGKYTVRFWHEKGWSTSQAVEIRPAHVEEVRIQLGE